MARPKKDGEEKLTERIALRVTLAERLKMEEEAAAAGLNVGQLVRQRGILNRKEIVTRKVQNTFDIVLIGRIGKIGNNVNQIAAALNKGAKEGKISDAYVMSTLMELQRTNDLLNELIEEKNGRSDSRRE